MDSKIALYEAGNWKKLFDQLSQKTKFTVVPANPRNLKQVCEQGAKVMIVDEELSGGKAAEMFDALRKATPHRAIPVIGVTEKEILEEETLDVIGRCLAPPQELLRKPTPEFQQGEWRSLKIEEITEGMGVTHATLAQILGTSERNLARWVAGETKPRRSRDLALQRVKYVYYLLTQALQQEAIPTYLREPSQALRGQTPLRALLAGDFASVEADLQQMLEGVYT